MSVDRLRSLLTAANIRLGLDAVQAAQHAEAQVRVLSEHCSGETIYIGKQPLAHDRDMRILADHQAGQTIRRIARRWGLSVTATFQAIRRAEERSLFQLEKRTRAEGDSAHSPEPTS